MSDLRADQLRVGMTYREYGFDDFHKITTLGMHGDRVLIVTSDGSELSLDADEVVDLQVSTKSVQMDPFTKDVQGNYFGGAYWNQADYRVIVKVDGTGEQFLLRVESDTGYEVNTVEFTDTQADRLRDLARSSEEADDEGLGLSRELHWHVGDERNDVDLTMNDLEELAEWIDTIFDGMDD